MKISAIKPNFIRRIMLTYTSTHARTHARTYECITFTYSQEYHLAWTMKETDRLLRHRARQCLLCRDGKYLRWKTRSWIPSGCVATTKRAPHRLHCRNSSWSASTANNDVNYRNEAHPHATIFCSLTTARRAWLQPGVRWKVVAGVERPRVREGNSPEGCVYFF